MTDVKNDILHNKQSIKATLNTVLISTSVDYAMHAVIYLYEQQKHSDMRCINSLLNNR